MNSLVDKIDLTTAGKMAVDLLAYVEEETFRLADGKASPEGMIRRGHLIAAIKAAYDILINELPEVPVAGAVYSARYLIETLATEVTKHIIRATAPKGKQ